MNTRVAFFVVVLMYCVASSLFYAHAQQVDLPEREQYILQVELLSAQDGEQLNYEDVIDLSHQILPNRFEYPDNIIAQLYLLLAEVEYNKGDMNRVFQFAQNGLSVDILDKEVHLVLLLKLAQVHAKKERFKALLTTAEKAVIESQTLPNVKYQLLALSYRSAAFAMLGKHKKSLADLQHVETGVMQNNLFSQHVELLNILAMAYQYLGDYQTALTLQLKILKLRFDSGKSGNIDETYYHLAQAYFSLNRFDDAYNAYWESKEYATHKNAVITVAYASQGLGLVLLEQQQFSLALEHLTTALQTFKQRKLRQAYIETLIALASAQFSLQQFEKSYPLLEEVSELIANDVVKTDYLPFYLMLATMYVNQGDYVQALTWQKTYSDLLKKLFNQQKKTNALMYRFYQKDDEVNPLDDNSPIEQTRKLAIKLAEDGALSHSFAGKFQKQASIIISLVALSALLLMALLGFYFRLRSSNYNQSYLQSELRQSVISNPIQTKYQYQLTFKKARQYGYPLVVVHLILENWQELTFRFSKKHVINEVSDNISDLISQHISDFDFAGIFNDGEYLLMFEHQSEADVSEVMFKLSQALKVRFFVSLGDFSVTSKYKLKVVSYKDIDPYLFLAKLSESKLS